MAVKTKTGSSSVERIPSPPKRTRQGKSLRTLLRQARRKAENPDMVEGSVDDFLNIMDIGGLGHERFGRRGFNSPDELLDWFKRDDDETDWRQRD